MNKKVLTLCAGFLLAGGLFSSANAIDLRNATPGQYYQLKRTAQYQSTAWTVGSSLGDYYATNSAGKAVLAQSPADDNSYWTIEVKNNDNGVKIVRLVNVHTGKALSVKDASGTSNEWFEVGYTAAGTFAGQTTTEDVNELKWGNNGDNRLAITQDGSDWVYTSATIAEVFSHILRLGASRKVFLTY